jgi:hypothetical protein
MSKTDHRDYEHYSTPRLLAEPVNKGYLVNPSEGEGEHVRIIRALGFTTGSPSADRRIFRERFEEWRWRRVSHWRKQGSLR